jgi:hypothetical protein
MGDAGRTCARETFDWSVVIRAYQDLWRDLAKRRQWEIENTPLSPESPPYPLRADPFRLFAGYPTAAIEPDHIVALAPNRSAAEFPAISGVELGAYARPLFAPDGDCLKVLDHLGAHGENTIRRLLELFEQRDRGTILRTIAWLAKLDLVRFP